jgi:hypothetical protein
MNNTTFEIILKKNKNQCFLQLNKRNKIIRKWCGAFAELINDKILIKYNNNIKTNHSICLNKNQIHKFFTEITCLHQLAIYHFKIESDLSNITQDKTICNISESLLLQIRINNVNLSYDDLLEYFLNDFPHYDIFHFDETIELLTDNKLIQSFFTDDGCQYFDKNIKPHNHIYSNNNKKLANRAI